MFNPEERPINPNDPKEIAKFRMRMFTVRPLMSASFVGGTAAATAIGAAILNKNHYAGYDNITKLVQASSLGAAVVAVGFILFHLINAWSMKDAEISEKIAQQAELKAKAQKAALLGVLKIANPDGYAQLALASEPQTETQQQSGFKKYLTPEVQILLAENLCMLAGATFLGPYLLNKIHPHSVNVGSQSLHILASFGTSTGVGIAASVGFYAFIFGVMACCCRCLRSASQRQPQSDNTTAYTAYGAPQHSNNG